MPNPPPPARAPSSFPPALTLTPHPLIALLVALTGRPQGAPRRVEVREGQTRVVWRSEEASTLTLSEQSVTRVSPRWLGVGVEVRDPSGAPLLLEGLSAGGGALLERHVLLTREALAAARLERERRERERLERERLERERLERLTPQVEALLQALNLRALLDAYLTRRDLRALQSRLSAELLACLRDAHRGALLTSPPAALLEAARLLAPLMRDAALTEERRRAHNEQISARELKRHKGLFDTIEDYPLTPDQRAACVVDEVATLVVAGAGTGKTSTLVGRCAYLLASQKARPEQVLLLAYAAKARDELSERLARKLGEGATRAATFHQLGLSIIGAVEGKRPSLAPFAAEELERGRYFQEQQESLLREEPAHRAALIDFCARYVSAPRSEFDFKTIGDYHDYLRSHKFVTLNGETVKSYGELLLANELLLAGVPYRYEEEYKHPTATAERRSYQPDFYLPDHDIYIELYGLDRAGQPAPFMHAQSYLDGIEWKRQLHARSGTVCLELFSYQVGEGTLAPELWRLLEARGVRRAPISEERALQHLKERTLLDGLSDLLANFVGLFKLSGRSLDDLKRQARAPRVRAFLGLFEPFFARYERTLKVRGWVDFEDMIATATRYVREGRYVSPYSYVLVDEFQDISPARFALLRALVEQRPTHKLFCVGDDWQAIYRFNGGDVSLMTRLHEHIDSTERVSLEQTFRFNSALLAVTSAFVSRNPALLKKTLKAREQVREPRVEVAYYSADARYPHHERLRACLERVAAAAARDLAGLKGRAPRVFLLSRYHFNLERDELEELKRRFPTLALEHVTAHASKGREADYVVVLALENKLFGFPNRKESEELIELVLPQGEPFPDAEEARLFYVALTRARQRVYLLASRESPSEFVKQLREDRERVVEAPDDPCRPSGATCPRCQTGSLELKSGKNGPFASCTLYPVCTYSEDSCERCRAGVVAREGNVQRCRAPGCGHVVESCPRCGTGRLARRSGRHGDFIGCSNFFGKGQSCRYTRNC